MKPRVALLPGFHLVMFVRGIVIADEVNLLVLWGAPANQIEETQPFLMPVLVHASADHAAIGGVHRGKKRGRSIALVIMGHGLAATLFERQSRLGAIESLDLALFIARKDDGMLGRRKVKPHDVFFVSRQSACRWKV